MVLAETIRLSLESMDLSHAASRFGCVTVSCGVAILIPDEYHTADMLIRMADSALYKAKTNGRKQVVLYGS